MVRLNLKVTVTVSLEWTSDVAGPVAVAAGPGTVSRRGRAPIGRVGPPGGPGIWSAGAGTRQAQSPGGLTAYATLCLKRHGHVSSFMCIPLCVSGIWVLTSLVITRQTDRTTFLLLEPLYGYVTIISGIGY